MSSTLRYLTQREHSAHELQEKLTRKGYDISLIQAALTHCQQLGLQNDQRFAESLCRLRARQGYGPRRIMQELATHRLDEEIIQSVLDQEREQWLTRACEVHSKKYAKNNKQESLINIQKQKQFLYYRGFDTETINQVFSLAN